MRRAIEDCSSGTIARCLLINSAKLRSRKAEWGYKEDPTTKAVTAPDEKHSVQVNFPTGGPHQDPDSYKSDAYLCVILRDRDTAALAFSQTRSGCMSK